MAKSAVTQSNYTSLLDTIRPVAIHLARELKATLVDVLAGHMHDGNEIEVSQPVYGPDGQTILFKMSATVTAAPVIRPPGAKVN